MDEHNKSNKKLTLRLLMATVAMFGFGFALVPLYDVMCDTLGINGKTNTESALQPQGMVPDESRVIKVEFMAHPTQDMPWSFEPKQALMDVHPGQVIQTAYVAKNLSNHRIVGQAVPSVSPGLGASYFNKIECFCFNKQPLAGQDIPESIHTLTLSYTLYDITEQSAEPEEVAALVVNDPTQGALQ